MRERKGIPMNMGNQKDLDALLRKFDSEALHYEPDNWWKGPGFFVVVTTVISLLLCWLAAFLFPEQLDFLQLFHVENVSSVTPPIGLLV